MLNYVSDLNKSYVIISVVPVIATKATCLMVMDLWAKLYQDIQIMPQGEKCVIQNTESVDVCDIFMCTVC